MRVVIADMIKMKFLTVALLSVAAINLHAGTVAQQIGTAQEMQGNAQDTMAQVTLARFQQEQADRAAQAAIAAQEAREQRDADLAKEIERCLAAGLPCPTEANWRKPTAYEEERAKFHALMRERMNAEMHHK